VQDMRSVKLLAWDESTREARIEISDALVWET
jgi:hypothetical protein